MRCAASLCLLFAAAVPARAAGTGPTTPQATPPHGPALAKAPPTPAWTASPAEPRDLVVLARLRNPEATIAAVQALVPVPNLRGMLLSSLGAAGAAVAPAAPLDVAVALNPEGGEQPMEPVYAVAVGVSSLDGAQRAIREQFHGEIREIQRGVFAARLWPGTSKEAQCLLGPSPGPTPLRLACSEKVRDLNALGPYLIRVAPQRDLGPADLHAEVRVAPAYQRYGDALRGGLRLVTVMAPQKLQLGHPGFDRALADAVQGLGAEIQSSLADIDRATVDLGLGQAGIELRMAYRLRGRASWLATLVKEEAARTTAPPALFFRLPRDSRTAYWSTVTATEARVAPVLAMLARLLDGYLEHEGLGVADRKMLTSLLGPWPERLTVWSGGPMDVPAGQKTPAPEKKGASETLFGTDYSLGGFEGPPDALRAWLQGALAAYNRPPVQALLRKKLKELKELNVAVPAPVLKALPLPKDLPKGSLGVQLTVTLPEGPLTGAPSKESEAPKGKAVKAKAKLIPTTLHLVLMPDGERTWIGTGTHLPTVLRRLREQPKLTEEQTIARREGLESLRQGRAVSAGYWTVAAFADAIWRIAARAGSRPPGEMTRLLTAAPNHGETPMIFFSHTRDGAALDRELLFRMPRASIEDIIAIALGLAMKN